MKHSKEQRCPWAWTDPLYIRYHDTEWGVPIHDDRKLFEFLILEGAQAGLSWLTILKKRPEYRRAFDNFDPSKVARYRAAKIERLLSNPGIVRNRLKVAAAVSNAESCLHVQNDFGSFEGFIWQFVDGQPVTNHWSRMEDVPTESASSRAMSRELKRRGFKFVGPTICYAFMQAVGMVNDHLTTCFRYRDVQDIRGDHE
ncbi:DNA-3-methyladenine glycosylase (EC [Olavius algarvensis associated proteobacterium Delta 3]|nr:DNA-3-methyladenine glycosylase (EC [Olavius algarvensis associated proteobacterium Delta 3]